MDSLRVALLNASTRDEATRENFGRDVDADVRSFAANEGELPDGYEYDAAVVSGSGASVYRDEPWIDSLVDWVNGALDHGSPSSASVSATSSSPTPSAARSET